MQARPDTQKAPTTTHVGEAVLVNGGPPPSLRSALHLGLHRFGRNHWPSPALPQLCRAPH